MNDMFSKIIEILILDVKNRFNMNEKELENLKKEWLNVIDEESNLKHSRCIECGNILCLGDLCK